VAESLNKYGRKQRASRANHPPKNWQILGIVAPIKPPFPLRRSFVLGSILGAVFLHGGFFLLIGFVEAPLDNRFPNRSSVVEVELVQKPPAIRVTPKIALRPPKLPKRAPAPLPLADKAPPPPNQPPSPEAKPSAPISIGISMSSTTTAGTFAAPVGNSLYGSTSPTAKSPADVHPYISPNGRYVPPSQVGEEPKLIRDFKAPYPPEARKNGLEGEVLLRLLVDSQGRVAKITLLQGSGYGFDQAAINAAKKFLFRPATEGGESVATEIVYTYRFLLD
jgi:protein TonB